MFAPTPLWDRNAKKRRKVRAARPASRTVSDPALDAGEVGPIGSTSTFEPADAAYETQPARQTEARRRGVPTGAVAAGVFAVAVIAGVGWYATSRPHDSGIEMTPGAPATSEIALNTAAPPSEVAPPVAPAAPPQTTATTQQATTTTTDRTTTPTATHKKTTTTVARASTPRVRPAQASSATQSGMDAATTAPMVSTPAPSPGAPVLSAPVAPAAPVTMAPSVSAPVPAAPAADPTVTP